jgi:hypothetical protein
LVPAGRLVTPIDVYIQRLGSAELTSQTSINILSPFQLKAAITATVVKANYTTTTVDLTFGVSQPYQIMYLANQYTTGVFGAAPVPGLQWEARNNVADIQVRLFFFFFFSIGESYCFDIGLGRARTWCWGSNGRQ